MTIHDYYGQKNGLLVLSMFLFYFCSRFIYNLIKSRKTWKYITLKPRSLKTSWTGLRIYRKHPIKYTLYFHKIENSISTLVKS